MQRTEILALNLESFLAELISLNDCIETEVLQKVVNQKY